MLTCAIKKGRTLTNKCEKKRNKDNSPRQTMTINYQSKQTQKNKNKHHGTPQ